MTERTATRYSANFKATINTSIKLVSSIYRAPQSATHTCITYDAVNQAYIDARKRIRKFKFDYLLIESC